MLMGRRSPFVGRWCRRGVEVGEHPTWNGKKKGFINSWMGALSQEARDNNLCDRHGDGNRHGGVVEGDGRRCFS